MTAPTLGPIRRVDGVAGQFSYTTTVTYPDEPASTVSFVGSTYGWPVTMITPGNPGGRFVTDPERFGPELNPDWVRKFFA